MNDVLNDEEDIDIDEEALLDAEEFDLSDDIFDEEDLDEESIFDEEEFDLNDDAE